jgi:signal peptidase I
MTWGQWILFFFIVQALHFAGTWKLYVKAGRPMWQAAVPIYNGVILMDIIGRPRWWVALLFLPIINLLMFPVIWVETARSFNQREVWQTWAAILSLGFYNFYISYFEDQSKVVYRPERSLKPTSASGDWVNSIVFAVVAATFVHTYFIQPYAIPTGSLERTLRVGDFLFVSKFHYGARVPMTTVAAPMVHDTLPVIRSRSYLKSPQLPYMRLPGFQKIHKNDIVVFSWPVDTVRVFRDNGPGVYKPIDKRSNYVKRCVGTPGDTLEIVDSYVHVNGERLILSDRAKPQHNHWVYGKSGISHTLLTEVGADEFNREFKTDDTQQNAAAVNFLAEAGYILGARRLTAANKILLVTGHKGIPAKVLGQLGLQLTEERPVRRVAGLTDEMITELKKSSLVDSVVRFVQPKGQYQYGTFPQEEKAYPWNGDQFGPIYIPQRGATVKLNAENLPLYEQIITRYEGNTLEVEGNQILINGQATSEYTFAMDYYWMMGDNRDNSEDSRTWGYVPADHILGKPVFIWLSFDNFTDGFFSWVSSPRWDRFFTTVGGSGKPISFLPYFLIAVAGYFGYDFYRKKKKKQS